MSSNQMIDKLREQWFTWVVGVIAAALLAAGMFFWDQVKQEATNRLVDVFAERIQAKDSPLRDKIITVLNEDIGKQGSILEQALRDHTIKTLAGTIGISTQTNAVLNSENFEHEVPVYAPDARRVFVLYEVVPNDYDRQPRNVFLRVDNAPREIEIDVPDENMIEITSAIESARNVKKNPPTGLNILHQRASQLGVEEFANVFKLVFRLNPDESDRPVHLNAIVFILDPVWVKR